MKITIISIGKFENSPHKAVFATYLARMKWKIELLELELKNSRSFSPEKIKEGETNLILKALYPVSKNLASKIKASKIILLHEQGKYFSSRDFAGLIAGYGLQGDSNLAFVIGGAAGLSAKLLERPYLKISFGAITLPHLMVRTILAEQLYRAQTIIAGHPYHRD
jgi:23S rRNA (pseudouridine1915-N3)-methyltransferase